MTEIQPVATPRIGISSCLLGEEVRYDGGHKHNRYVTQTLGTCFDFVAFCPEVAIGLGIPRPTIRLMEQSEAIRLVGVANSDFDVTDDMRAYATRIAGQIHGLSGYILKKDSPSCGMERVKVYKDKMPTKSGRGIYAEVIMQAHPNMPFEEEGRLMDPVLRENFITRVFTYFRWQQMVAAGVTPSALVQFHTDHKFLILAHDEKTYRELGPMVASAGKGNIETAASDYVNLLMQGLKNRSTPGKHANVLMHLMGFIKEYLDSDDKQELLELIDQHRQGLVPVIVPITLINHYLRKHPTPYVERQIYLEPHPKELMLRNQL